MNCELICGKFELKGEKYGSDRKTERNYIKRISKA